MTASRWSVAGLDPVPITAVLPPSESYRHGELSEWQGLYPLSSLVRGVSFPADGPDQRFSEGGRPPVNMKLVSTRAHVG